MMAKQGSALKTTFLKPKVAMKAKGFRFYSALAILEPQIYSVVEQFGAENISLLSGRLVFYTFCNFPRHEVITTYRIFHSLR